MNEFVVINNLDPSPSNKYIMDNLPLHVTLSNTFYSEKDASYFFSLLQEIAKRHKEFIVTTKSREMFADENVSVTEIEKTENL
jgi:2'-5' RNA ligase